MLSENGGVIKIIREFKITTTATATATVTATATATATSLYKRINEQNNGYALSL